MTTVKKDQISSRKFEKNVIRIINTVKAMEDFDQKEIVLRMLRELHNGCLEWAAPEDAFKIVGNMEVR